MIEQPTLFEGREDEHLKYLTMPLPDIPIYSSKLTFHKEQEVLCIDANFAGSRFLGCRGIVTKIGGTYTPGTRRKYLSGDVVEVEFITPHGLETDSCWVGDLAPLNQDQFMPGEFAIWYNTYGSRSTSYTASRVEVLNSQKDRDFLGGEAITVRRLGRKVSHQVNRFNLMKCAPYTYENFADLHRSITKECGILLPSEYLPTDLIGA